MIEPPCSGIIVIDIQNNETVLVCTEHDNYSFPKGKRHKGEKSMETAIRETEEETGLTKDDIEIMSEIFFDENSDRGNIATRYYVGILKTNKKTVKFDENELKNAVWIKYTDVFALEKFKQRRKDILKGVLNALKI